MLLALNIPALVSPLCPIVPLTFASATAKQRHKRYHLPLGFMKQYCSLYHFPSLYRFPSPYPALSTSRPVFSSLSRSLSHRPVCPPHPHHFYWHLHRKSAPSTAQRSGIRPVVIIIILVDYLIPIQHFDGHEVTWFDLRQLSSSIFALRSLLPYEEKLSLVCLTLA